MPDPSTDLSPETLPAFSSSSWTRGLARGLEDRPRIAIHGEWIAWLSTFLGLGFGLGWGVPFAALASFCAAFLFRRTLEEVPRQLFRGGEPERAARLYQKWGRASRRVETQSLRFLEAAECWFRIGKIAEAKAALAEVDPERLEGMARLGYLELGASLWLSLGDWDGARALDQALALDCEAQALPKNSRQELRSLLLDLAEGNLPKAQERLRQLPEVPAESKEAEVLRWIREGLGSGEVLLSLPESESRSSP